MRRCSQYFFAVALMPLVWVGETVSQPGHDLKRLAEFLPSVEGWRVAEKPTFYTHDNLFDYIDGSSELYYSYGFQGVVSAMYEYEDDPSKTVVVDIYDMGTPLGAFGVYSSMSRPELSYETIGCEAIVSSLQIRFWQDRYEVEINASGSDEHSEEALKVFAQKVAEKLSPCQSLPELTWLPERSRVPHSLKYVADGFLGQSFLPGGMEATYRVDGQNVRGFVTKCETSVHAQSCLVQYREAHSSFDGAQVQNEGQHVSIYHRYLGHAYVGIDGVWFYGAISQESAEASRKVAEAIATHLPAATR